MTSTMDRELRDRATKALASLLNKFPNEIVTLINEFAEWDDSYVRERVLAVASAGILYCEEPSILKASAVAADRMVFHKTPVERHAWTRRYAQIIVNHATYNEIDIDDAVKSRSAPPYASGVISDWPTLDYTAAKRDSASLIFSSVIGSISTPFDGKTPMMVGDFGRYTMGGIDNSFSEAVRNGQPPLRRDREIQLFWDKVTPIGSDAQDAQAKLLQLHERQAELMLSDLIKSFDKESIQTESDAVDEELAVETKLSEAECVLLELLPNELKQEYQRLQPLDKFPENGVLKFSLLKGQLWVFSRALELGWDKSLHENIERSRLRYSQGRHDHKIERIGKKYQHIAFAELVGYLADYHWYLNWESEPRILNQLEDFERSDIDATYLSGLFSKPVERFMPETIRLPQMAFRPEDIKSNMAWARTLEDIPDPVQFFIQQSAEGCQWCLQHSFSRNNNYMKNIESSDPFRSAQYSIELILVDQSELGKLGNLTSSVINKNCHDIFEAGWSSSQLFGQRSFLHQDSVPDFLLSNRAADFAFGRIAENYSPKYSEFDTSGISDESGFTTPHPALLAELKIQPKDGWSSFFVTPDGIPAFSDNPDFLAGNAIIRRDPSSKSLQMLTISRSFGGCGLRRTVAWELIILAIGTSSLRGMILLAFSLRTAENGKEN